MNCVRKVIPNTFHTNQRQMCVFVCFFWGGRGGSRDPFLWYESTSWVDIRLYTLEVILLFLVGWAVGWVICQLSALAWLMCGNSNMSQATGSVLKVYYFNHVVCSCIPTKKKTPLTQLLKVAELAAIFPTHCSHTLFIKVCKK